MNDRCNCFIVINFTEGRNDPQDVKQSGEME